MADKDDSNPRKHGRWLVFFLGLVFGAALASLLPRYAGPYLGIALTPSAVVEGTVVEKELQPERIILKISTPEGVLLASFSENREDIDLLVERGDSIVLGANRYRPFLESPTILGVREPGPTEDDQVTSAKQAYQDAMEAKLRAWEAKLSELEAKAANASGDAAQEYERELETLREKREALREKLSELGSASDVAWKDLKSGLDAAWSELDEALDAATARFRESDERPQ